MHDETLIRRETPQARNLVRAAARWILRSVALVAAPLGCDSNPDPESGAQPRTADAPTVTSPSVGRLATPLVSTNGIDVAGDTSVQSILPNKNAGGDSNLSLQPVGRERSLLFFDVPTIQGTVAGGTLLSARIELTVVSSSKAWGASGRPIAIHRLLSPSAEYTKRPGTARSTRTSAI